MEVINYITSALSILGFISIIIVVIRYLIEKKQTNFENVNKKINYSKYSSTRKCFEKYKDVIPKGKLAPSKGLIIKKEWDFYGNHPDQGLILLDDIQVEAIKEEKREKILSHIESHLPKPQNWWYFIPRKPYVKELFKYGQASSNFFNGDLYCASSFAEDKNGAPLLQVYQSDYFTFFNTCKVKEFMYEAGKEYFLTEEVLNLENRACGIGVNTLTLIRLADGEEGLYFLMHQRGKNVAEGIGAVHVVPAGSFQPFTSFTPGPTPKLSSTVYREFCEEVLRTSHMKELSSEEYLINNEAYKFLQEKDESNANKPISQLYFLGMGLEPYNTKMEILSLLYIDLRNRFKEFTDLLKMGKKKTQNNPGVAPLFNSPREQLERGFEEMLGDEGEIILHTFKKATLEQYFGHIKITPSAREIMRIAYERWDEIIQKTL